MEKYVSKAMFRLLIVTFSTELILFLLTKGLVRINQISEARSWFTPIDFSAYRQSLDFDSLCRSYPKAIASKVKKSTELTWISVEYYFTGLI